MRLFSETQVEQVAKSLNIASVAHAGIAEIFSLAHELERVFNVPFVKMDQGSPGLPPNQIGIEAEIRALKSGVVSVYPPSEGILEVKVAASRFLKAFLNIDVKQECCIPTVGSVEGSFLASTICAQTHSCRNKILFLDPGFPIQKAQLAITGIEWDSFDFYAFREEKLREKLEDVLSSGEFSALLYANPSNPAWLCLSDNELRIIADVANRYDVVVIEDLAYFGMDFRERYGRPYQEPYIRTVAHYTERYILLISSSKIFSYAGQRMAMMCVGESLFHSSYTDLASRYHNTGIFGTTLVSNLLEMVTSGCSTSAQYAYAAMLNAASEGRLNYVEDMAMYAQRAKQLKAIFLRYGFHIVYSRDDCREIGDGFFFTVGYGNFSSEQLVLTLLYYGVSTIPLTTTGATLPGVRCCTSQVDSNAMNLLESRLKLFQEDNPFPYSARN